MQRGKYPSAATDQQAVPPSTAQRAWIVPNEVGWGEADGNDLICLFGRLNSQPAAFVVTNLGGLLIAHSSYLVFLFLQKLFDVECAVFVATRLYLQRKIHFLPSHQVNRARPE